LNAKEIVRLLSKEASAFYQIKTEDTVTSTNDIIKEQAKKSVPEGAVLISREQTKGKGTKGRSFFSPKGGGIYMSVLLRPQLPPEKTVMITTAAAVSVCKAIENLTDKSPKIKWVNDILIDGKKVCGILTEGSPGQYAVLGIGINAFAPENGFPEEIKDIAGAVCDEYEENFKNELVAEILNSFLTYYKDLANNPHTADYKAYSAVLGKEIIVIENERQIPATALDIDDDCRLKVRFKDSSEKLLNSGEVSLNLQKLK